VGALFHVGLNVDRFTLDVNDPSTARAVEVDVKLAGELGVYAVPTLIIDRKWVEKARYSGLRSRWFSNSW
jgi:predicted DsbA family dithiol-disulfide isomerase